MAGLLLYAAWPVSPFTFLIFVALVPLFLLDEIARSSKQFFWLTYLALLIWNIGTTWWICNSTVPGGIAAIVLNPLLMCIPWVGFHNLKKRFGRLIGYISLVAFWLSFEYIHLNWDLSWPWLTLGNVFATHPGWVQWYEYTGTSGGTLWVLLVNLSIFQCLGLVNKANVHAVQPTRAHRWFWVAADVALPLVLSFLMQRYYSGRQPMSNSETPDVVIVQPNIDPWDEKFVAGKEEGELRELIVLSEREIDSATVLVVWPETAIPVAVNEDSMRNNYFIQPVWDFLKRHPRLDLLTGIEGFRFFDSAHRTSYSQSIPNTNRFYDAYNSAVLMDSNGFQPYHKSKLVPGPEILPSFLRFMGSWFEKFGGTTGGYARQDERTVLRTANHTYVIAPAVCYESIYGEFMSKYIRYGANLIVIITNDGWWRNTSGYKQHEFYARLRSIETRTWVARSANTGVSCFIDPLGNVLDAHPYNTTATFRLPVPVESHAPTFYVRNGDIISKVAMIFAILLVFWDIIVIIKSRLGRA